MDGSISSLASGFDGVLKGAEKSGPRTMPRDLDEMRGK